MKINLPSCAAVLLLLAGSIAVLGQAPEEAVHGTPGVASQRAVVNFAELARQGGQPAAAAPNAAPMVPAAGFTPASVGALSPSPEPAASFPAFAYDGPIYQPPDSQGAVGPNHLMVTLNQAVLIQDRSGQVLSSVTPSSFWGSLGPFPTVSLPNAPIFDPRVVYDPFAERWIFTQLGNGPLNIILVAVSRTSDPTGDWNLYRFDLPFNDPLGDHPSMGFNKDWIVYQQNMQSVSGSFVRSDIMVFSKTNLYSGGVGRYTYFPGVAFSAGQVPATTFDNSLSTMYLVGEVGSGGSGLDSLRLYTITGSVGAEVFSAGPTVTITNRWDSGGNQNLGPQLGSTARINIHGGRISAVVYRNGSLWATHHIRHGNPYRSAIQWWQLTPTGQILQRGLIDDPTGVNWYGYPSLSVNQNNDMLIGYSRYSTNQYPSANYSFRAAADPVNLLRAETVLKVGEAPFTRVSDNGLVRWGDYSATAVDPRNGLDLWTIQEYAATPTNSLSRWGTWWGRIAGGFAVQLGDVTVSEGDFGATDAVFTARLSAATNATVSVDYATEDASATAGDDYAPTNGTLLFLPGETNKTFSVTVQGDTLSEPAETFFVRLFNPTNVALGSVRARGTILNDDLFITRQPQGTNVRPGGTVAFSVAATGPPPIRHQWRLRGTNLAGATDATLTLTNVQLADEGAYACALDNSLTTLLSDSATLAVLIDPVITMAPVSQSVVAGGSATFSVGFTGNPMPFGVEWRQGSNPQASNTVSRFQDFHTLTNAQPSQAGNWRVIIRNLARNIASGENRLFVLTILPDSDADGLPDAWELAHGFPTNSTANATQDADGDGLTNGQEYQAGTNPTNSSSYLRVDSVSLANEGSAVRLTFVAASNNTYTVESRPAADAGAWLRLADVVAISSNRVVEILDPSAPGADDQRFYRLATPRFP